MSSGESNHAEQVKTVPAFITLFARVLTAALCVMLPLGLAQSMAVNTQSVQSPEWVYRAFTVRLPNYTHLQECAVYTASVHQIPIELLLAVLSVEDGASNRKSLNSDGTYDYGVMQINTVRLGEIAHLGVTETDLIENDCLALFVGGYVLKGELDKAESFWEGVGNYHYGSWGLYPHNHQRYIDDVYAAWISIVNT